MTNVMMRAWSHAAFYLTKFARASITIVIIKVSESIANRGSRKKLEQGHANDNGDAIVATESNQGCSLIVAGSLHSRAQYRARR